MPLREGTERLSFPENRFRNNVRCVSMVLTGLDSFAQEALNVMIWVPEWAQVVNTSGRARKRLLKYLEQVMRGTQADYAAGQFSSIGGGGGLGSVNNPNRLETSTTLSPLVDHRERDREFS
jgi:hypothetical protein